MKLSQLKIDPEFQSKIPPLQFEEEQQLEQNIIAEGRLLNPIIIWNGYILDGHTRYRILKKHGFSVGAALHRRGAETGCSRPECPPPGCRKGRRACPPAPA